MGVQFTGICTDCGTRFAVNEGGGFFFHLLHCDNCGHEKTVGFGELGETHARYLKGLSGPYSIATAELEERMKACCKGDPLTQDVYHVEVEKHAGVCACGGQYRLDAPPRCPHCASTNYSADPKGIQVMYD